MVRSCVISRQAKVTRQTKSPIGTFSPPDAYSAHIHIDFIEDINTNNSESQPNIRQSPTAPSNPVKQTIIPQDAVVRHELDLLIPLEFSQESMVKTMNTKWWHFCRFIASLAKVWRQLEEF
ncbi:hypothetical protein NPIL_682621 [Nephila pilipes]|uniref:Uncharacterized protein n=1 Tax=Nephila pilipes TaxID=299642 RepID=A0A8X6U8U0_NEPPI|nr:hypothetical protein NPIL_682621 [Nephila pilipes]